MEKITYHIKEIYITCKNLSPREVDDYIRSLSRKYKIEEEQVKRTIRSYVKSLSPYEQEEYAFQIEKQKKHKKQVRYGINNYVRTKSKASVLELLKLETSTSLCAYLDTYLIKNPKNIKEITKLKQELILLEQQILNKEVYKNYLESGNCLQSIVNLISLLFCDEEEAILLLKGYSIPKIIFDQYLKEFEKLFPDQEYDLEYLKKIYEKYAIHYKIIIPQLDTYYPEKIELLKKIVDSGDCLMMYLSKNGGYSLEEMKVIFKEIRKLNNPEYTHLIEIICSRDNSKFIDYVKEIALQIYEQDDFDIADYFEYTKLRPISLKYYVQNYITNEEIKEKVNAKLNKIFNLNSYVEKDYYITPLKNRVLSESEQKVLEYLKLTGILNVKLIFDYYLEKYENGQLDLETGKVKKVSK